MKKDLPNHLARFVKVDIYILLFILVVAFALRLYKIDIPLADFHSWRQADTAAVSRNFVKHGFDLMHPKYDDLSNIQSGKENPEGYRFVEFPLYNALVAGAYVLLPFLSLEVWGRLISIISSLIVIAILYYFLLKEHSRTAAIIGSLLFAIFPFFVFFSRVILPEMNALAFTFGALFFVYKFTQLEENRRIAGVLLLLAATLSFMGALLIKPTSIFYAVALLYLFLSHYQKTFFIKLPVYLFFFISALPLFLWRNYIQQFPEGIPANLWLITSVNTPAGLQPIFFRPAFFRWVFYERINNLILGGNAATLAIIGVFAKTKRFFLLSICLSCLLYIFVFQGGNVQHVYYQVLILPALAILAALGSDVLIKSSSHLWHKLLIYPVLLGIFFLSFVISYNQVKDYYNYSHDLVTIANVIKNLTNDDDKIVTWTLGDTTLLYLSDRKGAPHDFLPLDELKAKGYKYYVTLDKQDAKEKQAKYNLKVIGENEKFTLFEL
jgi:hypothetical protein